MAQPDPTASITLRTLTLARWVALAILAGGLGLQAVAPRASWAWWSQTWTPRDLRLVGATLVLWASLTVATQLWLASAEHVKARVVLLHLLADTALLTGCLALWGPAGHPFRFLYLAPVILGTQLPGPWIHLVVASTLASSATILLGRPPAKGPIGWAPPGHGTAWLSLAGATLVAAYLLRRLTRSALQARDELARLRTQTIQDHHLAALGTLAAGAAHELATPLGTVSLLAADLPHMVGPEQHTAVATICREVERCKDILARMASPEVRVSALCTRDAHPWGLAALQDELDPPEGVALTVVVSDAARGPAGTTTVPKVSVGQILRELVANGAQACRRHTESTGVSVHIDVDGGQATIEVTDDGAGMTPEVAAAVFDPFFTTKPEGAGMGLGLYLARAQLQQLGGQFELQSNPGRGTRVRLRIPLHPSAGPKP